MDKRFDEVLYQELYARLVPSVGRCDTVEGELLRAVSKIYHDYTNNGFGNNWSGALEYLRQHMEVPLPIVKVLKPYSKGNMVHDDLSTYDENDIILFALDRLMVLVLEKIVKVPLDQPYTPNTVDMWDLQQKDHCRYRHSDGEWRKE